MIHSLNKGKQGEREFAAYLNLMLNCNARRGQQFSGSPDSPDIVCKAMPDMHFEVKRTEKLNLGAAMDQAVGDSGPKVPVVAHRKNRGNWLVTLQASDIKRFSQLISEHLNKSITNAK